MTPERLPCGRVVDEVVEQVADGHADHLDQHQQECPHCQAALAEYDRIWAPLRELGDERVTAPDSVLETALARIRRTLEHPAYGTVPDPGGTTLVSARVIVVAARDSAERVPGVRVALSHSLADRVEPGPAAPSPTSADTRIAAGVSGTSTAVQITLAADYGSDLRALGAEVRRAVTTGVRELTDLEPVRVDVIIDDVFVRRDSTG